MGFLRFIWIALLVFCTAGFGICGISGMFAGLGSLMPAGDPQANVLNGISFGFGALGLLVALVSGFLLYLTLRPSRDKDQDERK